MLKKLFGFMMFITLVSCDSKQVLDEYQTVPNVWSKKNDISFLFKSPDTLKRYNLFLNVRNNNKYPFSNLFLITDLKDPKGNIVTDTLEYQMAKPDGAWLGDGSSIIENKLWFKENIRFKSDGEHQLTIKHAMRKSNNVLGVDELEGITAIGLRIETTITE